MATLALNERLSGPFVCSAGETDFPADWPLIDPAAVMVRRTRDGVAADVTGFAILNPTEAGFTVRLATPALARDILILFSRIPAERTQALQHGGAVRTDVLETDAVRAQAQLQEHRRDIDRSYRAPLGAAVPDLSYEGLLSMVGLNVIDGGLFSAGSVTVDGGPFSAATPVHAGQILGRY